MGQRKRWVAMKIVTVEKAISDELYARQIHDLSNAIYSFYLNKSKKLVEEVQIQSNEKTNDSESKIKEAA